MWEIETDCYIGANGLAYSNNRKYSRGEWPIVGLYVHPRTGLIREQTRRKVRHTTSAPISRPVVLLSGVK
jgi:hypothetical protein